MHPSCFEILRSWSTTKRFDRILDVGSYNINGTPRPLFPSAQYIGCDLKRGPDVDVLGDALALPFISQSFDLVICVNVLEHVPKFWKVLPELSRVTKDLVIFNLLGFRWEEHSAGHEGHYKDFWRFSPDTAFILVEDTGLEVLKSVIVRDSQYPDTMVLAQRSNA